MDTVSPFKEAELEIREAGGSETASLCYQCGKCDVVCPWNRVRDFSIRRIVREAMLGLAKIEGEDIWRCTTCGTCPSACPRGVQQIDIGVAVRRVAAGYGVFPSSVRPIRGAMGSLADEGNPLAYERQKRADWARGLGVQTYTEGMEYLYFVGCYFAYDPRMQKVAVATARLLQKAGVRFGILGTKESCCGESVRKAGGEDLFKRLARENIKTFIDHGVKRILVSSPHCYHTFKNEYPELMVRFEVVHISELFSELLREGKLRIRGAYPKKVTYHDPCYLGRHGGIYDAPREILRQIPGIDLVEMPDSREKSLCCGGGGGRIWMETPKSERFSDLRLGQAEGVGAAVLATSCPYCITNFEESRLGREEAGAPVIKDITEILAEALAPANPGSLTGKDD